MPGSLLGRLGKERKRGQVLIAFWTQIDTDEHRLKEEEGRGKGGRYLLLLCRSAIKPQESESRSCLGNGVSRLFCFSVIVHRPDEISANDISVS